MADLNNINLGVLKDITLIPKKTDVQIRASFPTPDADGVLVMKDQNFGVVKKTDTFIRGPLGLAIGVTMKVFKDVTFTAKFTDTYIRAGLGFIPKFLAVFTRITGTSTLPPHRKVMGFESLMNPKTSTTAITGLVTEDSLPSQKLIRLYDKANGHLLAETHSDPTTGSYTFPDVSTSNQYYIVAFDEDGLPLKAPVIIGTIQK